MKHNIQAKVQLVKLIDPNNTPVTQDFERWANAALALAETKPKHINPILEVVISDTATSAHLNKTYRQKPGPTNVLSFPFDEIPYEHGYLLGELVLCAEVIINEAKPLTVITLKIAKNKLTIPRMKDVIEIRKPK